MALLTDFGQRDPYAGVMKGVILQHAPHVTLVDLSHGISPEDVLEAAFVLKGTASYFPEKTLFVCVVDPGVGSSRRILYVKGKHHAFLAPDNGLLSMILKEEEPVKIIHVSNEKYFLNPVSRTFHGRDIFASVAGYLASGLNSSKLGQEISRQSLVLMPFPEAVEDKEGLWNGEVIYVDHFGNLITNFSQSLLNQKKKMNVFIKGHVIHGLAQNFQESNGKLLAVWGSFNRLEIAVKNGNASKILNVAKGDKVRLECQTFSS